MVTHTIEKICTTPTHSRLSLKVVYLWRHVSSTAPPFILWWSNLKILFGPLHRSSPFIGELRCQAIQMEHIYRRENPKSSLYCEMSMLLPHWSLKQLGVKWSPHLAEVRQNWYEFCHTFFRFCLVTGRPFGTNKVEAWETDRIAFSGGWSPRFFRVLLIFLKTVFCL
jgi:hypothetical protein